MPPSVYSVLKFAHVLGVVFFLGNVALAPYRRNQARQTGDMNFLAGTYESHAASGKAITMPWLVVVVLTGFGLAYASGFSLVGTGWLFWSLVLTVLATVIFAVKLAPMQRVAAGAAMRFAKTGDDAHRREFEALARSLEPYARAAGLVLYIVLALMVFKPTLPAIT